MTRRLLGYLEQISLMVSDKVVCGGIGIHSLAPLNAYTASPVAMAPENPLRS
jgi:hypothetical protein